MCDTENKAMNGTISIRQDYNSMIHLRAIVKLRLLTSLGSQNNSCAVEKNKFVSMLVYFRYLSNNDGKGQKNSCYIMSHYYFSY